MKKIKLILIAVLSIFALNSCEDEKIDTSGFNYVTFSSDSYSTGVDVGGTTTIDVTIYSGNISQSDRSIDVSVDGSAAATGSYIVPSSVTIPGGSNEGKLSIALSDTNLGIGVNKLVISFPATEELFNGSSTTVNYIQNCTEVTATLDITFDGYGSESGWTITDSLGGVVASKAAGDYTDGQVSAQESITLCAGRNYTFTMTDSYGDGLSFPANGTYSLSIGGTVKASGGGDFGSSESTAFDTN